MMSLLIVWHFSVSMKHLYLHVYIESPIAPKSPILTALPNVAKIKFCFRSHSVKVNVLFELPRPYPLP